MKKIQFVKHKLWIASISLFLAALFTFSHSLSKYTFQAEYPLVLALAEHFPFVSGQQYAFTVPYDGYYAFQLWGGHGGDSKNAWNGGQSVYSLGGSGGMVSVVAYFTKDEILLITVGTQGGTNNGGYNGGGNGGIDLPPIFNDYYGGGGGGATDVRLIGGTLSDRILVAGGGGGGSGGSLLPNGSGHQPARGGDGGTLAGFAGTDGAGDGFGSGGTQQEGGQGSQNGSLGNGGGGRYSGGGGGGGYYGGGGAYGSGGGGGGGSSYIGGQFTSGTPGGLPGRSHFSVSEKEGFAIVSYLGKY